MEPRFSELMRVRVVDPKQPALEGLIVEVRAADGWIYKVSIPDPDREGQTFDNWYAEVALEEIRPSSSACM